MVIKFGILVISIQLRTIVLIINVKTVYTTFDYESHNCSSNHRILQQAVA